MRILKSGMVAVIAAGLSVGAAMPAFAEGKQEGLVNVNVSDNDLAVPISVQVPIAIAANICGTDVNLLAQDKGSEEAVCDAEADAVADNKQFMNFAEKQGVADDILAVAGDTGNDTGKQEGLVNVNVSDNDLAVPISVQVPIAIAANVCGTDVNLLAQDKGSEEAVCDAEADAVADNKQFMNFAEKQGVADDILAVAG